MGQYYLLVNDEMKQYLSPCFGLKAYETYHNDAEFYGKALLLLYHDISCIGQGGGDFPFSEILSKNEMKMIGAWNKTSFSFRGDYAYYYDKYSKCTEDSEGSDYKCLNRIMCKIIKKIDNAK